MALLTQTLLPYYGLVAHEGTVAGLDEPILVRQPRQAVIRKQKPADHHSEGAEDQRVAIERASCGRPNETRHARIDVHRHWPEIECEPISADRRNKDDREKCEGAPGKVADKGAVAGPLGPKPLIDQVKNARKCNDAHFDDRARRAHLVANV